MKGAEEWYSIDGVRWIDSPALTVHTERIQYNIDQMIRIAGDPGRLMPHVKTYKMPGIVEMQMASGIHKFKCATIAEAEMLGQVKAPEALLAYQPTEVKLLRLMQLIKNYPDTHFSTLIDNLQTAGMIDRILGEEDIELEVYVDVNNGNNRTGIAPEKAFELYEQCLALKWLRVKGLHVYDGHIRATDPVERKSVCDRDFEKVVEVAARLRKEKKIMPSIIAGGSPSFLVHAERKNVICSPGTTLLWDAGYGSKFPDMPFLPAAVIITRIISQPAEGLLCLDLGHKSVAAENPLENRVRFLNAPGLEPVSQSEEHLVVRNSLSLPMQTGDVLYVLPYHICPTTALYQEVLVAEGHTIINRWEVEARTRKINY